MNRINFTINGIKCSVGSEVSSDTTLLDYIRHTLELRGTKYMCREAGCGACIVAAVKNLRSPTLAINSCMVPITSCQDWEIETIENLGNRQKGYHVLQKTLADNNGSQCGYCSPAWIMSMYCLLKSKKDLTMLEIEKGFSSNICRCTGYRPILESFKIFAKDSPKPAQLPDIEDLKICHGMGVNCDKDKCVESDWCFISEDDVSERAIIDIKLKDGRFWFRVNEIDDIFEVLKQNGDDSYMLLCGNTAKGAYPIWSYPRILIDINGVHELKGYSIDQNLIIGAGTTLSDLLNIFKTVSQEEDFWYLQKLYDHLNLVAHVAVRNIGSVGGNLMIKHEHTEFASDIYLMLETIGGQLTIRSSCGSCQTVTMQGFLKESMKGRVILNVLLPPLRKDCSLVTFKVMPRSQNAHAIVNAGFLYKLDNDKIQQARIVFGGLSANFIRASATETYLKGKLLFSNETLQSALKVLECEIIVTERPPEPSAAYRKQLALGLFYKGLLVLCPSNILDSKYSYGATKIHETRPVSNGQQTFETNPSLWPLNQPIPKVESLIQCAGEASYTEDIPKLPREISAAFVLSTVPLGDIISIDASKALDQPGVIAFYSAKDIPGLNSFTMAEAIFNIANEEVLCSGSVKYYNQPIGIVVAETQHIANTAAKMVQAVYSNIKKPVIDIRDARKDSNRIKLFFSSDAIDKGDDVAKVIKSVNATYGQYAFIMETLVCVIKPSEEGLEVYASTQWTDAVQVMLSRALNIVQNRIDVHIRRLGGSYGFKLSRNTQVAVACGLVVQKLNRPCRIITTLPTNMRAYGKRLPCCAEYEVGVNKSGVIQYMNYNMYDDDGFMINEQFIAIGTDAYYNCYDKSKWNFKSFNTTTDTAKNTWYRAPTTVEYIAMIELVMERIAYELALDPLEVRFANFDSKYNSLKEMVETVRTNSDYDVRIAAVNSFNNQNRWKKRGLRFSLMRWTPLPVGMLDVNLSVYHGDGTVIITHGGVEMGQGINTKAIQICAYLLKIPVEKIQIKPNNTTIAPNVYSTAGSLTTQNVGIGVRRCCNELLKRLEPIRGQLVEPTWEELITKAFEQDVDLQAHGFFDKNDFESYIVYGVALAEVEIDVLTGESEVIRVDLMEDVGRSYNPELDIGQVEGAFIMGLGYWTSEQLVYDPNTGELLTDRTWNYHVPQARDIPQDFRIYFRKNSYSHDLVLGSKCVGEPPVCMAVVIPFAIRAAIASARQDSGIPTTEWFQIDGPFTVEKICLAAATRVEEFKFY